MTPRPKDHGCQCPIHMAQVFSFIGYFILLIGFWTLVFPSLGVSELEVGIGISYNLLCLACLALVLLVTLDRHKYNEEDLNGLSMKYCGICDKNINIDSKHCRICDKCRQHYDHHCFFFNNCVSKKGKLLFIAALLSLFLLALYSILLGVYVIMAMPLDDYSTLRYARSFYNSTIETYEWYLPNSVYIMVAFGIVLHSSYLSGFHLAITSRNMYTWEFWDYYRMSHKKPRKQKRRSGTISRTRSNSQQGASTGGRGSAAVSPNRHADHGNSRNANSRNEEARHSERRGGFSNVNPEDYGYSRAYS